MQRVFTATGECDDCNRVFMEAEILWECGCMRCMAYSNSEAYWRCMACTRWSGLCSPPSPREADADCANPAPAPKDEEDSSEDDNEDRKDLPPSPRLPEPTFAQEEEDEDDDQDKDDQDKDDQDDPEWTIGSLDPGAVPCADLGDAFQLTYDKLAGVGKPPAIGVVGDRPAIFTAQAQKEGAALVASILAGKMVVEADTAADHTASDHSAADHTEERQETLGAAIDRLLVTHDVAGKMKEL